MDLGIDHLTYSTQSTQSRSVRNRSAKKAYDTPQKPFAEMFYNPSYQPVQAYNSVNKTADLIRQSHPAPLARKKMSSKSVRHFSSKRSSTSNKKLAWTTSIDKRRSTMSLNPEQAYLSEPSLRLEQKVNKMSMYSSQISDAK